MLRQPPGDSASGRAANDPIGAGAPPSIGLLGDVMLGRGVGAELTRRSPEELWSGELRALVSSLDLVICNLECCLSQRGEPTSLVRGKPFFFRGPPAAVQALRAIGVSAVSLANNHALDFGEEALDDTLASLAAAGIATAGAGFGSAAAQRGAVVSAAGHSVALIAVSDHPREYAAAAGRWGVAHAALLHAVPAWLAEEIVTARVHCDFVIAFPHWGPNMTTRPAGRQRRRAAELQAMGADLVAGHSAHLFHGVEWTARGPVVYDLGDALDDYRVDPVRRNDLGILAIWRPGSAERELELVGLRLRYARTGLAKGADAEWIAVRLERACQELGTRVERASEHTFRVLPR
jgi:poly-gamma-glutamate capsule biosynthesis protein CapA/YwtB (metallophosphatase superfamily)